MTRIFEGRFRRSAAKLQRDRDGYRWSSLVQTLAQARRFLLVGAATTSGGLALVYGLIFSGLGPAVANLIGYAVALPLSYVAHSWISFRHKEIRLQSFSRYIVAVALSYLANFLVVVVLTRVLLINGYLAQIPAFAAYAVVFFFLNRLFVFPQTQVLKPAAGLQGEEPGTSSDVPPTAHPPSPALDCRLGESAQ